MSLIFIGDIHQNWHVIESGLASLAMAPSAAILLGDIECTRPLDQVAAPLLEVPTSAPELLSPAETVPAAAPDHAPPRAPDTESPPTSPEESPDADHA